MESTPSKMKFNYDLFVIGAGPGGLAAAKHVAASGFRVAIAARQHKQIFLQLGIVSIG